MADATYKVIGLSKKKGKSAETLEIDYQPSHKGEKEKYTDKQKSDDYYDDRLSRDSQLDTHLKQLVSDGRESTEEGGLHGGVFVPEEEGRLADEFYEETGDIQKTADTNIAGEIYTPAALKEMLGDWEEEISPPTKPDQPRGQSPGQNASRVSSEMLININDSDRDRRTPVEDRMTARMDFMQGQLNEALAQVTMLEKSNNMLEEVVTFQREFIAKQQVWNTAMATEADQLSLGLKSADAKTDKLSSGLVAADAKAEAAQATAKQADIIARKSADMANKALQVVGSQQTQLKALEVSMAELNKAQQTLLQNAGRQADKPAAPLADTFENSIFFGGIQPFRERLGLHPLSDPIFVISRLLRDTGIYAGMNSIVLADNAAKCRTDTRAVIIHMQSAFHKRAAMAILRRELASQRLPGTSVRDCFPTSVMAKVKGYTRLGMRLKSAGKIAKFQVINRKGQPILQTGARNQNFADYQGEGADLEAETADTTKWTLVEGRRKRPHLEDLLTSPNSRPLPADNNRANVSQPKPTAATWAAITEQEFPELGSSRNQPSQSAEKVQTTTSRATSQVTGSQQPAKAVTTAQPPAKTDSQQQPRRGAEAPKGAQPGSYPGSRPASQQSSRPASQQTSRPASQQNSRPTTPPPIRSLFDDDNVRFSLMPKPQRQFNKAAQHRQHLRNDY